MSEMVERVAKAMWVVGGSTLPFESLDDPEYAELKKSVLEEARAAIEAMREPTDQMIVAAYKDTSFVPNISPTGTWQAMVDEALR